MKKSIIVYLTGFSAGILLNILPLFGQGYGGELTIQGLNNVTLHSAASRAAGSMSVGAVNDIGLMFHNPATLKSLKSFQVSLGGLYYSEDARQVQQYAPVRNYPNFSLLMEGRTDSIPELAPNPFGYTPQDSIQRPYDDIGPNWSRSKNDKIPVQVMIALPVLTTEKVHLVAGAGLVEYANLNHYYQNNNVLSPDILSRRPLPTLRPVDNTDPLQAFWSQNLRSRQGQINGYGLALAGEFTDYSLSMGFSAMVLDGSSDDYERNVGRGDLTFYTNAFTVDSVYQVITKKGTSEFSGMEFSFSSALTGRYVTIGFSFKLPTTITRSYSMRVTTDTTGTPTSVKINGEDEMKLPFRGMIGLSLRPRDNLRIGLEYEFRPYESAYYTNAAGKESTPWLSASVFRMGVEYFALPWLTLRAGMRGEAEIFEAEGNKIEGEPTNYTIYTTGIGIIYSGFHFNMTYENTLIKYQDIWAGVISKNRQRQHIIVADLSYEIPWNW